MIERPLELVVELASELRRAGLPVSTGQTLDLTETFEVVGFTNPADTRSAARAVLARFPEDYPAIDAAVASFYRKLTGGRADSLAGFPSISQDISAQPADAEEVEILAVADGAEETAGATESASAVSYSARDALRRKDFAQYTEEEVQAAKRLLRSMRWQPPVRQSRRKKRAAHARELDMRRLLRRSLSRGGEVVEFPRRRRRQRPRAIVVLCDVSGSMDVYTRMALHFLHVLRSRLLQTEIFLFGTRLSHVTRALERRNPDEAVGRLAREVVDWAGGTRVGESIATFNRHWAKRVGAHGAVTIIISDGWDRGDVSQLSREMARLQRTSHRLMWLNPLLGTEGYQPLTQGMRAALPYIDDFIPAHNLLSLEDFARAIDESA